MCFRPAEASVAVTCPECNKRLNKTQGFYPKTCPFCKANLSEVDWEAREAEAQAAFLNESDVGTPVAPSAPKSPSL